MPIEESRWFFRVGQRITDVHYGGVVIELKPPLLIMRSGWYILTIHSAERATIEWDEEFNKARCWGVSVVDPVEETEDETNGVWVVWSRGDYNVTIESVHNVEVEAAREANKEPWKQYKFWEFGTEWSD